MHSYAIDTRKTATKLDYWNQAMREVFRSTWNVQPARPRDFQMTMRATSIGNMVLSRASLSAAQVFNQPRKVDHDAEHPFYIYAVNQKQRVEMGDRSLVLGTGDFTLADAAMMSTMTTDKPYTTIGLTVPANLLRRHVPNPDQAVGVRFSGSHGLSRSISRILSTMWQMAEASELESVGEKLATNVLEMFAICCYLTLDQTRAVGEQPRYTQAQIKELIKNDLRNPDLNVESIANQLGISVRYLQTLFARENETLSAYIRQQRLEGCRRQLSDPVWRNHGITEIAFSWGFNNATHFSRAFKNEFGISARDYRKSH